MRKKQLLIALAGWLLLALGGESVLSATGIPTAAPWKLASSPIAITPDGITLLVVNPDSNTVSLVMLNAVPPAVTELPTGSGPHAVAISPDGRRAYVANRDADSVSVIDLNTQTLRDTIPVGDRPVGVVVAPDGASLFVAELGDDTIRWLDAASQQILAIFPVPDRPHGLALTPDGTTLLVTHLLSGDVTALMLDSGERTTIPTWANVAPAPAVVISGDGTRAYLPQTMAHGLGHNTQFDNTVFPKVSVLDLETLTHRTAEHISLPETDQPVGLPWDTALAREGAELWVVNSASNDLSVIDLSTPTRPVRAAHIPVSDNPRGIVISPDGTRAYVNNTLAGTVSVIDTATYTVIDEIAVTTIPLPPLLLTGKRLFSSSARPDVAQAGWIACATCHVEGEQDGRTWLLQYTGEVPAGADPVVIRNTTSLLGMIETYPLRWSAEWDESADAEFSVRFEQFGSGLIADGAMHPTLGTPNQGRSYDLDALAAYTDSLLLPERAHDLTPQEERGRVLFESETTQCDVCHPAPLYTDRRVHDVGTVDGEHEWFGPEIDTPTLRFLYDSAPYLHDGSATTLFDVLTSANPTDAHGVTSHLSAAEIDDLVAYLLALPYQ
ncbi:MAG: beta-propeller fold lactonase family protein [Anaerolineae bacterium]|nr:beta-propeller fold lactonase family protein [Anaerolineae bacterium]